MSGDREISEYARFKGEEFRNPFVTLFLAGGIGLIADGLTMFGWGLSTTGAARKNTGDLDCRSAE